MNKVYGIVPSAEPFKPRPEILCHPNIPKPLHGIAPRVIAGQRWWDDERQKAYAATGCRCAACGVRRQDALGPRKILEAHECYDYDYGRGRLTMREVVALCPYCHAFIHSGLTEMLYNGGQISAEVYEAIMENGHRVLKQAGLTKRWMARHDTPCGARWADWRLVFQGKEYGPSTKCMDDWLEGLWKDWKPPQATAQQWFPPLR